MKKPLSTFIRSTNGLQNTKKQSRRRHLQTMAKTTPTIKMTIPSIPITNTITCSLPLYRRPRSKKWTPLIMSRRLKKQVQNQIY